MLNLLVENLKEKQQLRAKIAQVDQKLGPIEQKYRNLVVEKGNLLLKLRQIEVK